MTQNIEVARKVVKHLSPSDKTVLGNELIEGAEGSLRTELERHVSDALHVAKQVGTNNWIQRLESLVADVARKQ